MTGYVSYEDGDYAMQWAAYEDASERERYEPVAPCPACFESCGYLGSHERFSDGSEGFFPNPLRPCPECGGTGSVECGQITLEDLENIAAEEAGQ